MGAEACFEEVAKPAEERAVGRVKVLCARTNSPSGRPDIVTVGEVTSAWYRCKAAVVGVPGRTGGVGTET